MVLVHRGNWIMKIYFKALRFRIEPERLPMGHWEGIGDWN